MKLTAKNTSAYLVHVNDQGYESNGTYWGVGEKLYRLEAFKLGTYLVNVFGKAERTPVYIRAASEREARIAARAAGFTVGRQK